MLLEWELIWDIRNVIHYGLPRTIEGFVQEIGRAGGDGKSAVSVTVMMVCRIRFPQWLTLMPPIWRQIWFKVVEGFPTLEWLLLHTVHHRCTNVTLSLLPLSVSNCILTDPFAVERILPKSVLNSAPKDLYSKDNPDDHVVEFNGLGKFNGRSLRVLQIYFSFKSIKKGCVWGKVAPWRNTWSFSQWKVAPLKYCSSSISQKRWLDFKTQWHWNFCQWLSNFVWRKRQTAMRVKPFACRYLPFFHQSKWVKERWRCFIG